MALAFTQKVRQAKDVLFKEVGGESVLLNLKTKQYHGFDAVGTRMWKVLTSSESIEQARDLLLSEYDVDRERLDSDLHALIARAIEHGLAEIDGD